MYTLLLRLEIPKGGTEESSPVGVGGPGALGEAAEGGALDGGGQAGRVPREHVQPEPSSAQRQSEGTREWTREGKTGRNPLWRNAIVSRESCHLGLPNLGCSLYPGCGGRKGAWLARGPRAAESANSAQMPTDAQAIPAMGQKVEQKCF